MYFLPIWPLTVKTYINFTVYCIDTFVNCIYNHADISSKDVRVGANGNSATYTYLYGILCGLNKQS